MITNQNEENLTEIYVMEPGCNISDHVVSSWDIVKVVTVDVFMVLSLAGNIAFYASFCRRQGKLSPPDVLTRFIFGFGIAFTAFSAVGFTLSIFCGEIFESYALCAVYGLLSHVGASGWVWLLTIASVERYTKCVKTAEYSTWFSSINVKIMLWGAILLLGVIFFAPVYGWGQYSVWRGKMSIELQYNASDVDHAETVAAIFSHLSNATDFEAARTGGSQIAQDWLEGYKMQMAGFSIHQTGLSLVVHARQKEGVACMWRQYEAGVLSQEASVGLQGIFATPLLSNMTYYTALNKEEVETYENTHLSTQASSTCGLDFTLSRGDSYAFTIFLLLAMLGIPLTVILFSHLKILCHSRRPRKVHEDKLAPGDYGLAKTYFTAALSTVLLYMPYYVIDIISGAGYSFSEGVHFLRHLCYFCASLSLCSSYLVWKRGGAVCGWVQERVARRRAGGSYSQEMQKSCMLPPAAAGSTTPGEDAQIAQQLEEELILGVGGPSASSTETQITTL